jgi:hypothetical protein
LGLETRIKWPNDLLYRDRKAGGILVENRRGAAIAGVGINLGDPPEIGPDRDPHAPPPGALPIPVSGAGGAFGVWKALAKNLILRYNRRLPLPVQVQDAPAGPGGAPDEEGARGQACPGFGALAPLASRRLYGMGSRILVADPRPQAFPGESSLEGRIAGLDPGGALIVSTEGGIRTIWSGTVLVPGP